MSFIASIQNVPPKAGTPGVVQESHPSSAPAPSGGGSPAGAFITFLPLLMIVPILFLMSRRQKKEAQARAQLKKGDKVLVQPGIVGELVEMDDRFAKVTIAPGVHVRALVGALSAFEEPAKQAAVAEKKK